MAGSGSALTSKEILDAQTHLWNLLFGFMNSYSLKCAIDLGIPDAIHNHGKPATLTELTSALSIPSCRIPQFQRFMRLLVHNGLFTQTTNETDEVVYAITTISTLLIKEKGMSTVQFIEMVLDQPLLDPWQSLTAWFKSEQPSTAFEMFHGLHVWKATGKMPDFGKKMREGLESDSDIVAKVIIEDCADQFQGIKSLVEVAGGTGKIALALAKAFPRIKCAVLDLPLVIDVVEKTDEIEYIAGDMFVNIPQADALILKWVFITWNDEECIKILKRCKEAIPNKENRGKVIVIEKVIDANTDYSHPNRTETEFYFDIQELVHTTGKVRTEKELKKLFDEAGFKEYKIIPALGMRCLIELYH